jgi:hypothetical protein
VEQGTHQELLAAKGHYATLYHSQFAARTLQDVEDQAEGAAVAL